MLMGIDLFEITIAIIIILGLLLPLHIYFLFIKKGGVIIYSDKSSRHVMELSMIVFVASWIVPYLFFAIIYLDRKLLFAISPWTLFILSICAMVTSLLNACIYLIFKKVPPNHKDGLIGGIIGSLVFFLLFTLRFFSLYGESQYKTFTDFIFRSYLSFLTLMPLFAGVVQGIIGGYYIGRVIRSIIGSLVICFVVVVLFIYIFFTFGGH